MKIVVRETPEPLTIAGRWAWCDMNSSDLLAHTTNYESLGAAMAAGLGANCTIRQFIDHDDYKTWLKGQ